MAKKKVEHVSPSMDEPDELKQAEVKPEDVPAPLTAVDLINEFIFKTLRFRPSTPSPKSLRSSELVEELKTAAQAKRDRKNEKRLKLGVDKRK
jgi:hypothetical protein